MPSPRFFRVLLGVFCLLAGLFFLQVREDPPLNVPVSHMTTKQLEHLDHDPAFVVVGVLLIGFGLVFSVKTLSDRS